MSITLALILFFLLGCFFGVAGMFIYYIWQDGYLPFTNKFEKQNDEVFSVFESDRNEY